MTYYVTSHGDDLKSGNSDLSAWKTIAKVNSMNFNPGDIVSFKTVKNLVMQYLIAKPE